MTVQLKGNLYARAVYILSNFWHCINIENLILRSKRRRLDIMMMLLSHTM